MSLCPVLPFNRAENGYAVQVSEWIANPHAYFKSFGPEARTFQKKHPSERLRTMTLVAPAAELAVLRPVRLSLDGREVVAKSWSEAFSCAVSRLVAVNPATFDALQAAGRLEWLGSSATVEAVSAMMDAGRINPQFADWGGGRRPSAVAVPYVRHPAQRGDCAGRSLHRRGVEGTQGGDRPQAFGGAGVHGRTPSGAEGVDGGTSRFAVLSRVAGFAIILLTAAKR